MSLKIDIRSMLPADVAEAVQCFSHHYDVFDCPATVEAFLQLDPEAFFVATLNNKVVGVCGSPFGPQQTAFFGLYGIQVEHQGRGIGSQLFQKCHDYVATRNAGLYAVPEMQDKYMKQSGFKVKEGVSMVNLVGIPEINLLDSSENIEVILPSQKFYSKIIEYDFKIHQESREKLLGFVFKHPDYTIRVALNGSKVLGYGCIRPHPFSGRMMLGPLYSDNFQVAESLATSLLKAHSLRVATNGIVWNAIDSNSESINLARKIGLVEIERCERVFTQKIIQADYQLIYSVFSPDFSL